MEHSNSGDRVLLDSLLALVHHAPHPDLCLISCVANKPLQRFCGASDPGSTRSDIHCVEWKLGIAVLVGGILNVGVGLRAGAEFLSSLLGAVMRKPKRKPWEKTELALLRDKLQCYNAFFAIIRE